MIAVASVRSNLQAHVHANAEKPRSFELHQKGIELEQPWSTNDSLNHCNKLWVRQDPRNRVPAGYFQIQGSHIYIWVRDLCSKTKKHHG